MSKYKLKNSIWFVLFEGLKIYFLNIDKFFLYMLFPVFGQIIGIALAMGLSLSLMQTVVEKTDNALTALLYVILLAVPGLLIFAKAFWDYMVAYVALNSMTEGAVTTGKVYDFQSHNEVATRRTMSYVVFLLVICALSSVGSTIFFIVPGFIVWIYLILVYQVFTFEPDLNITDILKRSFLLVKGSWFRTLAILTILTFFSIFIITQGVIVIFDFLNITNWICSILDEYTSMFPLELVNEILEYCNLQIITPTMISHLILTSALSFVVAGLTLPIRSICWTLWYMVLSDASAKKSPERTTGKKNTGKRTSGRE